MTNDHNMASESVWRNLRRLLYIVELCVIPVLVIGRVLAAGGHGHGGDPLGMAFLLWLMGGGLVLWSPISGFGWRSASACFTGLVLHFVAVVALFGGLKFLTLSGWAGLKPEIAVWTAIDLLMFGLLFVPFAAIDWWMHRKVGMLRTDYSTADVSGQLIDSDAPTDPYSPPRVTRVANKSKYSSTDE